MSRSTYRRLISSIQNISLMIYFNLEAKIFRENLVIKKDSILSDDSKVFKIKDVIKYIENNYRNDINITTLANICHYNEYHFMRFFKKYTG